MLNKSLCFLILTFSLILSTPAVAQSQGDAVRGWVRAMGQLWLRADPEDRAVLFRKVWHHRSLNGKPIRDAAKSLVKSERRKALRDFYTVLAAPIAATDPFEEKSDLSLDGLLEQSQRGNALARTVRYSHFLQALDKEKGSLSSVLRRLNKKHKSHPWLKAQKTVVKGERGWNALKPMLAAVQRPLGMSNLKRCRFVYEVSERSSVSLSGWLLKSKTAKFACYGDDLYIHKYDQAPTFLSLSFETDVLLKIGTTIKASDKEGLERLLESSMSLPTTTLVLAYYAESLGRRTLAMRLFQYAERAFKTLKLKGSMKDLARGEICEKLWRRCAGFLIDGQWSMALSLAERVKKHLKGAYYYDSCADIVPGLRTMVKEKRPPAGEDTKSRLKRAVYDLRNTRSQQWGMPGGIQLGEGGAMGVFVEIGWEAIPTLIELIGDERPTRVSSQWRAWSPPSIYDYGSLAESALQRIIGQEIRKILELEKSEKKYKNFKERARAWWARDGKLGRVKVTLKFLRTGRDEELGAMVDKLLTNAKMRGEAGPEICRIFRGKKDPELRRRWMEVLGSYPDLGIEPDLRAELKSENFKNVLVAAEVLLQHFKDAEPCKIIEARLDRFLRGAKIDEYSVSDALQYIKKAKSKRFMAILEEYSKKFSVLDQAIFDLLKDEADSKESRRILVRFMVRPRKNVRSSTRYSDGRFYLNLEVKDEATMVLAARLGIDEKSVFPCPQCKEGKARDIRIDEIIKKFNLD